MYVRVAAAALAAIAVGAVIGVVLAGRGDVGLADATVSPTPPASQIPPPPPASASEAPSSEPLSTPTSAPTPAPNAALPNRSIADVRVDQLNVRAAVGQAADVLGQLRAGARVFTIGAPESAEGMHWYRVAVASGPYSGGDGCHDYRWCESDVGWVASPITGDPWLRPVEIGCPASPVTADALESLLPLERLHCFGNQEIVVTGTINHPCCGYVGPVLHEPAWLALPGSAPFFGGTSILFRSSPESGLRSPERGEVIRATAHLDDPASPTCRQSIDPAYPADEVGGLPNPAWVVLSCRTQLVVSEYEVTGTEDLGPCCGADPAARPIATNGIIRPTL